MVPCNLWHAVGTKSQPSFIDFKVLLIGVRLQHLIASMVVLPSGDKLLVSKDMTENNVESNAPLPHKTDASIKKTRETNEHQCGHAVQQTAQDVHIYVYRLIIIRWKNSTTNGNVLPSAYVQVLSGFWLSHECSQAATVLTCPCVGHWNFQSSFCMVMIYFGSFQCFFALMPLHANNTIHVAPFLFFYL